MILIRSNGKVTQKFLGYALKAHQWEVLQLDEGSTGQTELNRDRLLDEIMINYPVSLDEQNAIVGTLESIDRKLIVNEQLNDNLQQQAMALYAEMFLNSSDNNVTSGTLSDIAAITMGQSPSGSSYNEDGVGEVFYQGRAEFGFRFPKRRLFTTEPKRMAETGDVLLSVRAPVGDLNVAYERCCIGRGLGAIHSKTGHSSFVLYTMFALRSQLDVFNGEGTVFGSINRDALNAIPIDIPPVTEIDQFEAVAHPIDELIRANYEENCRLEAIRDSLLPKLMSGEIDVSAVNL
jgi:type I restriction enzyme S subunit